MASNGSPFQQSFGEEIVQNSKVHLNLSQEVIVITEDRFRLCLQAHIDRMLAKQRWLAPVSLLVTLLVVFATSTFREFILPATTWQAVFVLGTVATGIWACITVWDAFRTNSSVDVLVSEVKKTSEQLKKQ